jgi:hypothetical protein
MRVRGALALALAVFCAPSIASAIGIEDIVDGG